ncbi:hypothetical protein L208DRAFT_1150701, partial [Tricholoma matsutake]
MTKALTKVVYKLDNLSTREYMVIVNPEEYNKWKEGGKPATSDSFAIFHSSQGHQGFLGQPSNQQLDTDFGTTKGEEVVRVILEKGKKQASDSIAATNTTTTNKSRGSGSVD